MAYIGDIRLGDTFDIKFCTVTTTGAPTQLAGSPVISAYVGNSTTQITAGITLSVDFDGVTGLNNVRVVATSGNGYATASNYQLVITTGTVGGTSVVGYVVAEFSIEARSALMPTTAARTLDVTATGAGGVDWANVEAPTTAVGLTGTTIATSQVVASVSGAVGSVTGAVGSVAAGGITAASIATGAVDADAIAADAVTEIQSGLATAAALDAVDNFLDTEVAAILAAVDTEVAAIITTLGTPAGVSLAADIAAIEAQTDDIGAAGAGLTALATQASVNTIDDFLDTEIAAILVAVGTTLQAEIDGVQADTEDIQARLPAALTAGGNMKSDVLALNGVTGSAAALERSAATIVTGTVDDTAAAPTTTEFEADDITEATADHYNGRIIIFTSGAMLGQATDIIDYALVTGRGHFTVTALTEAPANNVTFVIV